jgi:hypothetical protein
VGVQVNVNVFETPCSSAFADYTPCTILVRVAEGADGEETLLLTLYNFSGTPYGWTLLATGADDVDCSDAGTVATISSFQPMAGTVASMTTSHEVIAVSLASSTHPPGAYGEHACLLIDGAESLAIPIDIVIGDAIFQDGFEA